MRITSKTTPEQYQAWLNTFPSMREIAAAVKAIAGRVYKAIRSCLWNTKALVAEVSGAPQGINHTISPMDYNKNIARLSKQDYLFRVKHLSWRDYIRKQKQIQDLDDKIGMQETLIEALEILSGKETN